jgi:hypothetical protein
MVPADITMAITVPTMADIIMAVDLMAARMAVMVVMVDTVAALMAAVVDLTAEAGMVGIEPELLR